MRQLGVDAAPGRRARTGPRLIANTLLIWVPGVTGSHLAVVRANRRAWPGARLEDADLHKSARKM